MRYGFGDYVYELVEGWGERRHEWDMSTVPGVAVDANDHVYILSRGKPPVVVMDRKGRLLEQFGNDGFGRAHAAYLDESGTFFCVDDAGHAVYRFDAGRKVDFTLGNKGVPSDTGCVNKDYKTITHGGGPFNYPTDLVIAKDGSIYVSDGYGNARVHKFSAEGKLLFSWGEPGDAPGYFNLPHGITLSPDEKIVYVADRQNCRIQLFDHEGNYLDQWTGLERPAGVVIRDGIMYVAELKRCNVFDGSPSRISILSLDGRLISRLENDLICDPNIGYRAAHGVAVDSEGSIYVAQIGKKHPKDYFALLKYRRV
ncbi:peptidyl-alpha-hydroxyglycine alpha-amidating lyase family protein [Candidatus Formimonas warabiya]|uniref:6-bladed beta-propeller n=1 Tax=Formimonas warabiya TaxID=1761012 RepID=A0A3G1KTT7_FORW1|nr:peptidyl-alpha-hydroxyglycine alpha-amidating lyase family protein [Candidatus Formimonas warabiya]ATW25869.1 hypothetical protein DCMF_14800 [Candidatus Formimonas warabiya]